MNGLLRESARFTAVGMANTAVGLAVVFAVMYLLEAGPIVANAVGYAVGWGVSFLLHRSWTFGSALPIAAGLPKYLMVVLVSYLLNLGTVLWAASSPLVNPYVAQVLGMGVYTVAAFAGCRWFVFHQPRAA